MARQFRLAIELAGLPALQPGDHPHWAAKRNHDRKWQKSVGFELLKTRGIPEVPFQKAHISCARYSSKQSDMDNLTFSFKPIIDALLPFHRDKRPYGMGVIADDNPNVITVTYQWKKCARGHGKIQMVVYEEQPTEENTR